MIQSKEIHAMEQDIQSPEVKDNLEAHKIAEEEPKESHKKQSIHAYYTVLKL